MLAKLTDGEVLLLNVLWMLSMIWLATCPVKLVPFVFVVAIALVWVPLPRQWTRKD